MSKTTITFNGVVLTNDFIVSELNRPFLMRTINTTPVDGRNGALFRSVYDDVIEISMRLAFTSEDKNERVIALANLVQAINVDEPAKLEISDDNGWYYMALPKGGDISRWIGAESFPLTFVCPDPARYGTLIKEAWPAAGNRIKIGGNTDTFPKLSFTATPKSGTQKFKMYISSSRVGYMGSIYKIDFTLPSTSPLKIEMDCATRKCFKTQGSVRTPILPNLTTEFPAFRGGWSYTYTMPNGGSVSDFEIEYYERWL